MTQFLIRRFIRHPNDPQDPATRTAYGNLASGVGMACNLLLCLGKLLAGTLFGSIAIMADALNNLSDASSNVVSLIGFRLAAKAPDAEHPYGHARYEYLAGLVVSVTILGIGFSLLKESVVKVFHPTPVAFSWLSVGVLAASILVKLWMSRLNRQIGTAIDSETLLATAADARNDVITTAAVLAATILTKLTGFVRIDGLMGIGVAAFILYSGAMLVKDTINPLLGAAPDSDLVEHIEKKALSYPGVLGVHDLMIHDYGPGRVMISLHAEVPANEDVLALHDEIDNVEKELREKLGCDAVIHMDPVERDNKRLAQYRSLISRVLMDIDIRLSFHDFRIVGSGKNVCLVFDLVVPREYKASAVGRLKNRINNEVSRREPGCRCSITAENSFRSEKHGSEK